MLLELDHSARVQSGSTRLTEVMANYLLAAPGIEYCGAEGMTVEEVVCAGYRSAVEKGWVPSREQLVARHPDLIDEIMAFFWWESHWDHQLADEQELYK